MSEPEPCLFTVQTRGGVQVVTVAAEQLTALDATDSFNEQLVGLLQERPGQLWVLDFQTVTFMVTPAVNTLVTAVKRIRTAGGEMALTGLNRNIAQVFSLMRLDEVFHIYADADAAIKALTQKREK